MSALCPSCDWAGSATRVVDGGRCPECRAKVNWISNGVDHAVIHAKIESVAEFNRSALVVLSSASTGSWGSGFVESIRAAVERGMPLSEAHQQSVYKLVNRHHGQIHNRAVLDFAANHAKGAD